MNAENLVDLLAQKNLVSAELVAGLRDRIAQSPLPIPADVFAERLVEHGVLTPSLADALLRQLRGSSPDHGVPAKSQASSPSQPVEQAPAPSLPFLPLSDSEPARPQPASPTQGTRERGTPEQKEPEPGRGMPEHVVPVKYPELSPFRGSDRLFSQKKIAANPWDSKLVLYGGSGLFILFLLGFFFLGSLFQRSAETMFAIAEKSYDSGAYPQAIVNYTDFLSAFPKHSNASVAKIRRALARIRMNVDAHSDWSKTLEIAKTELATIENESDFYEETKSELAVLLPKIAAALGAEASEKSSSLLADHAEATLALIDKYLPKSQQPTDQLAEVRAKIERVRRSLVMQDKLGEMLKKIEPLINGETFDRKSFGDCVHQLDTFHREFPEAETDQQFVAMLLAVSKKAHRAIESFSQGDERLGTATQDPDPTSVSGQTSLLVSLIDRQHKQDAPNVGEQTVFAYAEGSVFALRATDGTPRWRKTIAAADRPEIESKFSFQAVPPTKQRPSSSVLLVDSQRWVLMLLDAESGAAVWNYTVGAPFRMSKVAVDNNADRAAVAISTPSGEIRILSFGKEVAVQGFQLPQPVDSAPMVDLEKNVVYQLGDRNTLYVLSLDDPKNHRSIFSAHKRGEVRTAPALFGANLLIVFQNLGSTNSVSCSIKVWDTANNDARRPNIPIRGLVDTAPEVDGSFAVLTSDSGETTLFELVEGKIGKIAEGSLGGETTHRGVVRYVSLIGKTVWTADWQLMRFETQLAQSRLLPKESVKQNIVTIAPLRRLGKTLFHVYRNPTVGGVFVEAVATDNASILWETELADRIVLEPTIADGVATVYTSDAKSYKFKLDEPQGRFEGVSPTRLPKGTLDVPLAEIVPLREGFQAWNGVAENSLDNSAVVKPTAQNSLKERTVMIYDPTATDATRFRTLMLPTAPTGQPIALNGDLLIPFVDGQIALFSPKTLAPTALPFVSSLAADLQPIWTQPIGTKNPKEFVIVDNRPNENKQVVLYKIALLTDGDAKLAEKGKSTLDRPVRSPIAIAGDAGIEFAALVDDKNTFQTVKLDEMKPGVSENLSGPCLWGPFSLGDSFVLATAKFLYFFGPDGKQFEIPTATPIGKPFVDGDNVYFNSVDGKFWSVDRKSGKLGQQLKTGVRASVGPIRVGDQILCSGRDGAIYTVKLPKQE